MFTMFTMFTIRTCLAELIPARGMDLAIGLIVAQVRSTASRSGARRPRTHVTSLTRFSKRVLTHRVVNLFPSGPLQAHDEPFIGSRAIHKRKRSQKVADPFPGELPTFSTFAQVGINGRSDSANHRSHSITFLVNVVIKEP